MITKTDEQEKINYIDTVGFGADIGGRGFHLPVDISNRTDGRV